MGPRGLRTALIGLNLLCVFLDASATVYNVGTSTMPNWMLPNGSVNYTEWAKGITLRVGDSLYFKYNPNLHNVISVNSTSFAACDTKNFLQVWDEGESTVLIQEPGMHYFTCEAPTHCQKSQAFSILALAALESPPQAAPSNSTAPAPKSSSVPALHQPVLLNSLMLCLTVLLLASIEL
ncbi:hypothetical protein R1sor_020993 [Riccia sorocarpa]|uniref:Phytocyanin domain-containing protein n=1 Tax=Riccia sorocarpa TaxID=122646 RepID=A0ABD3GIN7_9MARC